MLPATFAIPCDQKRPLPLVEFFDSWWLALADRGWDAVVLHSWQEVPEKIESDIDYTVRGPKPPELLRFLAGHAHQHGWRLIQVIEHEPEAFFCVCQQAAPPFEALQLDVAWSYKRLGHPLVPAELLFEDHRALPGKSFRVPSPGSEFTYLLAKAAAKGKYFESVRERLNTLLAEDATGCRAIASQAFGTTPETNDAIDAWQPWFATAPAFRPIRRGRRFGKDEWALYLRRILKPTGLRFCLDPSTNKTDVLRFANTLRPSFRDVVMSNHPTHLDLLRLPLHLIRTRLVIQTDRTKVPDSSVEAAISRAIDILANRVARRLGAP